jgi:N6-L-threonylcarbamoyladenine synthase
MSESLILGIETSCDDTSVALLQGERKVLASVVSSQNELHAPFGGIVPEIAARRHLELILPITSQVLKEAGVSLNDVTGIGVTTRPGLVPSLVVGLSFAKALAWSRRIPWVGVDHLEAHIFATFLDEEVEFPFLALVVSGGHTSLFVVSDYGELELLGETRDDAAGEAFDKVASLLQLGYPGGPVIDRAAKECDPTVFELPRPYMRETWDFSFSGLKTAVVHLVEREGIKPNTPEACHVAAAFQEAVVDVLAAKILRAAKELSIPRVVVAGGVAANSRLRSKLGELAKEQGLKVKMPPLRLCGDNGAMVAFVARYQLEKGKMSPWDQDVRSRISY